MSQQAGHQVNARMLLDLELRATCQPTMGKPSDLSLPWHHSSSSSRNFLQHPWRTNAGKVQWSPISEGPSRRQRSHQNGP